MTTNYVLALDVGGTFIKAAVVETGGWLLESTLSSYPSQAKAEQAIILADFGQIFIDQLRRFEDWFTSSEYRNEQAQFVGIGLAFPGPFDYERGICLIQGLDKYEAIYGLDMGRTLRQVVEQRPGLLKWFAPHFPIVFENDARLFAFGEWLCGQARNHQRSVCLTLGTGLGSAFLEGGRVIKQREDVPPEGWLYNQPFRGKQADDYISRRGLLELAREYGLSEKEFDSDLKKLAELARSGNRAARRVFEGYGQYLGEFLSPYLQSFQPQALVLGGQIAHSSDLFETTLKATLAKESISIRVEKSADAIRSTLLGVNGLLDKCIKIS